MLNESFREKMSHTAIVAAVVGAAYVAFSVHAPTAAADAAKAAGDKAPVEKCFGVAKAGENFCAAANGSHQFAGHASWRSPQRIVIGRVHFASLMIG